MKIVINGKITEVPTDVTTLGELLDRKEISRSGTGIALNGSLCKAPLWDTTTLHEGDQLQIFSAAFGG